MALLWSYSQKTVLNRLEQVMKNIRNVAVVVAVAVIGISLPSAAHAFGTWSTEVSDQGNCANCHGEFRSGDYFSNGEDLDWGDTLHNIHLDNTDIELDADDKQQCDHCHGGSGTSGREVNLQSSAEAKDGVNALSCMGCHGRLEDGAANIGAGLRKHHMDSANYTGWPGGIPGSLNCATCHGGDPATPVGEHTAPPWYASVTNTSIMKVMNACSIDGEEDFSSNGTGTDNDGDGVYDMLDSDCAIVDPTPGDFDFDGMADILLRNTVTGQNWLYTMDGVTVDTTSGINTVSSAGWAIVGNGDYDGNGTADILWRNSVTGQNWMYLMSGSVIATSSAVNTVSNLDWKVVGSGDYNGDGSADILLRNDVTGQNWMYLMTGATIDTSSLVNNVGNLDWKIVGSGDFDNDGNDDILMRNSSTGQNWMYLMTGATVSTSTSVNTVSNPDSHVAGIGDYDADGDADIIWHNDVSGKIWMYLMSGSTISSSPHVITVANTDWEVAGDGDHDGDGDADIVLRNGVTGQNWMYLMDGATVFDSLPINTVSNTQWQIIHNN
jgi:hypothetical protein